MGRWPTVRLGEVCAINPKLNVRCEKNTVPHMPYVSMADVDEKDGVIGSFGHRNLRKHNGYSCFQEGDIIFAKITPCMENGKAAVVHNVPGDVAYGSTEFHVLRPSNRILPEIVHAWIRRPEFRSLAKAHFTGSAGQRRVPAAFLANAEIPLPPLEEQRRIVDLLERAAAIRKLRERALAQAKELIPALFLEMFGDPVTNPRGWPRISFSDVVADITRRAVKIPSKQYLRSGQHIVIDQSDRKIAGFTNCEEGIFREPLPVIIFGDHTRRFKIVEQPFFIGAEGVKVIVPKTDRLLARFLFWHLKVQQIPEHGYSRHFKFLRRHVIMAPPIRLQDEFCNVASELAATIDAHEYALERSIELERSLLAHLFK